jgi:hypothetical protein
MDEKMRRHLFYAFLWMWGITAIITVLGLLELVKIREGYFAPLFGLFVTESAGAVVAVFKRAFFVGDDADPAPQLPPTKPVPSLPAPERPRDKNTQDARRPDVEEKILVYLSEKGRTRAGNIALVLKLNGNVALHHLEELEAAGLATRVINETGERHQLTAPGRKYLVTNKLIT